MSKYIDFYIGKYSRLDDVSLFTVFGFDVYQRVGDSHYLLGIYW